MESSIFPKIKWTVLKMCAKVLTTDYPFPFQDFGIQSKMHKDDYDYKEDVFWLDESKLSEIFFRNKITMFTQRTSPIPINRHVVFTKHTRYLNNTTEL